MLASDVLRLRVQLGHKLTILQSVTVTVFGDTRLPLLALNGKDNGARRNVASATPKLPSPFVDYLPNQNSHTL